MFALALAQENSVVAGKNDELTAAQKKRLKKKAAEAKKEATAPSVTSVESGMHSSPHAYLGARRRLECAPDEPAGPTLTPAEKIAQLKAKKEAAEAKKLAEKKMKDKEFQERQRRAKEELAKKNGVVKEHGDGSGVMWIG